MEPVLIFIALFASIFGISYFYLITRNKERLALIQSGADASLFTSGKRKPRNWNYSIVLVLGFMAVGIGLGILVGHFLEQQAYVHALELKQSYEIKHVPSYFPHLYVMAIFFFGGLGLIASFFTLRAINKKDEQKLIAI